MSRRRLLAAKLYKKTEKHQSKFTLKFAFLLVLLAISLVMQAFGDTSTYIFLDHYVRNEITKPLFLVFFTTICLAHVMLHKYLVEYNTNSYH